MIITIDGPVASGKSSVAKALARELGLYYLNTGFLYRAMAYIFTHVLKRDVTQLAASLQEHDLDFMRFLIYEYRENTSYMFYDGKNISGYLSESSIEQLASVIAANALVRTKSVDFQRQLAQKHDVIADGRDCGSVMFPNADYKFYLTADVTTRAHRLMADKTRTYAHMSLDQVQQAIRERDHRDQTRTIAPLTIPEGALVIDNSAMTFQQTLAVFLKHLNNVG